MLWPCSSSMRSHSASTGSGEPSTTSLNLSVASCRRAYALPCLVFSWYKTFMRPLPGWREPKRSPSLYRAGRRKGPRPAADTGQAVPPGGTGVASAGGLGQVDDERLLRGDLAEQGRIALFKRLVPLLDLGGGFEGHDLHGDLVFPGRDAL